MILIDASYLQSVDVVTTLALTCPCGEAFQVPEYYAGKKVRCPGCAEPVRVPRGEDDYRPDEDVEKQALRLLLGDACNARPSSSPPESSHPTALSEFDNTTPSSGPKPSRGKLKTRKKKKTSAHQWIPHIDLGDIDWILILGVCITSIAAIWFAIALTWGHRIYGPPFVLITGLLTLLRRWINRD